MKFSHRIWLVVTLAILGTLLASGFGLYSLRQTMEAERLTQVNNLLGYARGVLDFYYAQEKSGKLSQEEAQAKAKEVFSALRNGNDYFFIRNTEHVFLIHPDPKRVGVMDKGAKLPDGRYTVEVYAEILAKNDQGTTVILTPRPNDPNKLPLPKLNGVMKFQPWQWVVGTGFFVDDMDNAFWSYARSFIAIVIGLLVVMTGAGLLLLRSLFGQLGGEPVEAAALMRKISTGDLSLEPKAAGKVVGGLMGDLHGMVSELRKLIVQIDNNASQLSDSAGYIRQSAQQINEAADQQASATTSMAASVQQLAVSSSHISDRARDTQGDAHEAIELATGGRQRVNAASDAIKAVAGAVENASARINALEERAEQISSIAHAIKDIAGQTNLLALNAAIEAARAGEAGRGFAVVADEVRKLAERTSLATGEIEQMVTGIQQETAASVEAMNTVLPRVNQGVLLAASATELLQEIENSAERMLGHVSDVADATGEQSAASTAIAQKVEEISRMLDETCASINATNNTAQALHQIAQQLKSQVAVFKV